MSQKAFGGILFYIYKGLETFAVSYESDNSLEFSYTSTLEYFWGL